MALKQHNLSAPDARKLLLLREAHMGCGGYIISQDVAKKLLNFIVESKVLIPVDHFLFRECPELAVYQLSPALCIQDMILTNGNTQFPSALEEVRNIRKGKYLKKEKLKFSAKLKKECSRIIRQIQKMMIRRLPKLGVIPCLSERLKTPQEHKEGTKHEFENRFYWSGNYGQTNEQKPAESRLFIGGF